MNIGERIKSKRLELGMSVDDIAAKLGKNRATIYRYESNEIENMPATILEPLSEVLCTTPAYLMGWCESADSAPVPQKESNVYEFTSDEIACINKYRALDDHGKKTVNIILDSEYDRCTGAVKLTPEEIVDRYEVKFDKVVGK